ncbi:MAG: LPS export ABC transporter ATP-binding protein [Chlamydiota bacterium]|nr:LPS export ABC transporter ATP-binding protein [Chlamydiota bacterium]
MIPIFTLQNIHKSYGHKKILRGISLHVNRGECVGLLGPNGAGKTTCCDVSIGLKAPDSGLIFSGEEEITSLPMHRRGQIGMGYLPQESTLFPTLSVVQNLTLFAECIASSTLDKEERIKEAVSALNLSDLLEMPSDKLSGGQRRRVEIGRALIMRPSFLLFDEPFANIDPLTIEKVCELIVLLKEKGIAIMINDHQPQALEVVVDRCYLMMDGKILMDGTMQEVKQDQRAIMTYFGSRV